MTCCEIGAEAFQFTAQLNHLFPTKANLADLSSNLHSNCCLNFSRHEEVKQESKSVSRKDLILGNRSIS